MRKGVIFFTLAKKYLYYCHMKTFLKWDIKIYNPKFYKWEVIIEIKFFLFIKDMVK